MITAITNARIFDGLNVLRSTTVLIQDQTISEINSSEAPENADVIIDAKGMTLLPGLIDAHTHSIKPEFLAEALKFGVTTELEMMGHWSPEARKEVSERDDIADLRTADFGLTCPDGHPAELFKKMPLPENKQEPCNPGPGPRPNPFPAPGICAPTATNPDECRQFVADRVASGADYIKIMIEEGTACGEPGLPQLDIASITAGVEAAHDHGKLAVAHTMTVDSAQCAISAGMDGLTHMFMDPPNQTIVGNIAESGAFVTSCLSLISSCLGIPATHLAADPRVAGRIDKTWIDTLRTPFSTYLSVDLQSVLDAIKQLKDAGVDILAGTDAAAPVTPGYDAGGGLAHGASLHHELQLLVQAGWTPAEALTAATEIPARRFNLEDRGRIAPGMRADLLLVEGNPTEQIEDTLNIFGIWRRGAKLMH